MMAVVAGYVSKYETFWCEVSVSIFTRRPTTLIKVLSVTTHQKFLILNKLFNFQLHYLIFRGP